MSLIMLDSAIRRNKRYYPQALLEERKYKLTRNKVENLVNIQHKKMKLSIKDFFRKCEQIRSLLRIW